MRAAGLDGTALFDQYHRWVNFESMLEKCLVGFLVPENQKLPPLSTATSGLEAPVAKQQKKTASSLGLPMGAPVALDLRNTLPSGGDQSGIDDPAMPARDWYQTATDVVITLNFRKQSIDVDHVSAKCSNSNLSVHVPLSSKTYRLGVDLSSAAKDEVAVKRNGNTISIILTKADPATQWSILGTVTEQFLALQAQSSRQLCKIKAVEQVTHDARILMLEAPTSWQIPIGHHIDICASIGSHPVARPYTPIAPIYGESDADNSWYDYFCVHQN